MGANPSNAAADPRRPVDSTRIPVVIGVIALAAVAFVGALVLIGRATQDRTSSSACIADLVARLPDDLTSIDGVDLEAARAAGFDDSSIDELVQSSIDTGVRPDPVIARVISGGMSDDVDLSHEPAQIECWVGSLAGDGWVARGEVDPQRVEDSDVADLLVVSEDGTLLGSDASMLVADGAGPAGAVAALDALGSDLVAFSLVGRDGPDEWIGLGLLHSGTWDLAVSWSFADASSAERAEPAVREVLESESRVPDLVIGDLSRSLTREGPTLSVRGQLLREPSTWTQPLQQFDPIFVELG